MFASPLEMNVQPVKIRRPVTRKLPCAPLKKIRNKKNIPESLLLVRGSDEGGREDGGFGWRERWLAALLCSL